MSEIELIAFDMGGVLSFYDEDIPIQEFKRLSPKTEKEIVNACYTPERKRPLETGSQTWPEFVSQIKTELELDISNDEFKRIYDSSHYKPNEDLFDVTERIVQNYRIGICSNTGPTHWELQRDRLPHFDQFEPVILSCDVGIVKPDRGIFDELSSESGVSLTQILFIDDHIENVQAAISIGMKSILFTESVGLINSLSDHGIQA